MIQMVFENVDWAIVALAIVGIVVGVIIILVVTAIIIYMVRKKRDPELLLHAQAMVKFAMEAAKDKIITGQEFAEFMQLIFTFFKLIYKDKDVELPSAEEIPKPEGMV